jgi:hypothetical protein
MPATETKGEGPLTHQRKTMMPEMNFEAFLPHFSGFSSAECALLVSDPQHRAAQQYAKENLAEGGLDAGDYIKILEQMAVSEKQRPLLAQKYTQSVAIQLAFSMSSPHGLQFDRYDFDADRIVVTIPLRSIRRLIMLFKLDNLAPLFGTWGELPAGELDSAVTECLRRLDRTFVGSMLGAGVKPSIEKRELKKFAGREADRAFNQSVDWGKLRSMLRDRRREKRQIAAAVSNGPASH